MPASPCLAKTRAGHRCKREAKSWDLCGQHFRLAVKPLREARKLPGWIKRPLDVPPYPDA